MLFDSGETIDQSKENVLLKQVLFENESCQKRLDSTGGFWDWRQSVLSSSKKNPPSGVQTLVEAADDSSETDMADETATLVNLWRLDSDGEMEGARKTAA